MSAGFVAVPVVPTFKGMSKEFSQRLEKPAQESGKRAGEAMSKGLEGAVENIERQVKASSSKLKDLDRAYEVSVGKRAAQQEKLEAATLRLQDAEEKYQAALEKGGKGTAELAKVKDAKARVIGETEKLEQAEINVRAAEEKHKNQLDDLNDTLAKLQDSQSELNRELEKSGGAFSGAKDRIQSMADSAKNGAAKFGEFAEKYKFHATAALGGIGLIAKESMAYAAEAEQSYGAVESIFADHAQGIIDKSKQAATEVGVSGREYRELSANMGAMLKNMGMPMDEVADKSQNLVGVAADLAATFGGTTKEAVESVTSLLRGETDPIEKYGVSIKQADIEARMAADGLDNLSGEAEKQAKSQTLLKLLTEQTASAQGQFARETDTAAHKQQVATAKYNDAKEAIGTALLPIMAELADKASGVAKIVGEHPAIFIAVAGAVGTLSAAIVGAATIAPILQFIGSSSAFASGGLMGFAASMWAAIAPVAAVIAAVAALGAALWAFFTKTETGREIWETFTNFLSDAWDKAVEKITKGVEWLKDTLSELWGYLSNGDFKGLLENMLGVDTDSGLVKGLVWLKDFITGSLSEAFGALRESVGKLVEIFASLGQSVGGALLDVLKGLWDLIGPLLLPTLKVLGGIIGGVLVGAIMAAVKVIEYAAKLLNVLLTAVQWLVENALVPLIDVIGNLVGGFLSGLLPALQSVAGFIGGAFMGAWNLLSEGITWAWENVIQPIFNAILQVAKVTIGVIGTIVLAPFLIAWNLLSSAIQAAWETVIKPVWEALANFAQNTLWPVVESTIGWMGEKWQQFADLMGVVWGWLQANIFAPFMDGMSSLGQWFSDRVNDMAAAWDWFKGLLQAGWNFIDSFVFAPIRAGIQLVAGWFRDRVNDIIGLWQSFQNALHAGWLYVDQQAFQPLGRGLETVKGWFRTAVDAIGRIWDGIRDKTRKPVQFVVDVVYNNGIRKAWNAVAGLVGLDKLNEIKFATGGVLPGYTPGRDPYTFVEPRTGMRIGLSGGEAIMRPEFTAVMGEDSIEALNRAARQGGKAGVARMLGEGAQFAFARGGVFPNGDREKKEDQAARIARAVNFMKAEDGKPYQWGGVGNPSWDCSGLWSGIVNELNGKPGRSGRLFNTTSLMANPQAFGFKRGLSGPITVGVSNDHMAGTLAGTNAESRGGDGVLWGRGAWGSEHGYFPNKYTLEAFLGEYLPGASGGGGFFDLSGTVKRMWDAVVDKIPKFEGVGEFAKLPGAMLKKMADAAWSKITESIGKFGGNAGTSGSAESWRDMAMWAMRRTGFNADDPAQVNAMLSQIQSESGGNPGIMQQGYVDVNTGGNEAVGLLQVIPGTFEANRDPSLPNDRRDPQANMVAALRYYRGRYGTDLTTMWGHGHGYALGGVIPKLYDQGGWLPHGGMARNESGRPEPVFNHDQWQIIAGMVRSGASIGDLAREVGRLVPELHDQANAFADFTEQAQTWLAKAGDYNSTEGINARQGIRQLLDLGLDLPGSDVIKSVLDGEKALWDSRARAVGHTEELAAKEEALTEAKKKLHELETGEVEMSVKDKRKLADAEKALAEAQAAAGESAGGSASAARKVADAEAALAKAREGGDVDKVAKAEEKLKRAREDSSASSEKANDKVAKAEEKLSRVREDLGIKQEEDEAKRAEEIEKANEAVTKAEGELATARKKQAMDLDNVVLLSQGQIEGLIPQVGAVAEQLISMGAPAGAVQAGLGGVVSMLGQVAGFAGPAGITLGVAMEALKVGVKIVTTVVKAIVELVEKIRKARLEAVKTLAEGWSVIAEYAKLVSDLQGKTASLQQALVRGVNAQREAEYNLALAQHDRYIAETEGALKVAEARLALDDEIKRGATAAQLKMMGLHEDWDSYMAYQASQSQGVLKEWSDAAISALFTYEKARAEALKGEVTARLEQIKAEAALAEAQRQNVRNQQDLLRAQERLIRMSAKVAGVDLVEATGTAQVAKLMAEMAEVKQAMDKNTLGRWGAALGAQGSHANEYRGQQAQYESLKQALDAVLEETGVNIDRGDLDRTLKLMGRAAFREGDAMAVLRAQMPELVQAETALRVNEALKPVQEARDQQTDLDRQVEDLAAEIGLYEQTTPLERTLKGLDYTIQSLDQASSAFADGNEELRGEYLAAARANHAAAQAAGVDWKLDSKYATPGVKDQVAKEVTIHMEGNRSYTADEVDALLKEVTAGSNVTYTWDKSSTKVAASRRKERI